MATESLNQYREERYDEMHTLIMDYYAEHPGAKQVDVARALNVHKTTVRRHLLAERSKKGFKL